MPLRCAILTCYESYAGISHLTTNIKSQKSKTAKMRRDAALISLIDVCRLIFTPCLCHDITMLTILPRRYMPFSYDYDMAKLQRHY